MKKRINKSKKKKKMGFFDLFAILLFVTTIIFLIAVVVLDILIVKYLVILGIILLIINAINIFLIRKCKVKFKIFASICSLLLGIVFTLASVYIFKTQGVLLGGNVNYKTYDFSVLVLNNDNYNTLEDLENETIGYYEVSDLDSSKYLKEISKKVEASYEQYVNYTEAISGLMKEEVAGVVIEDSYLDMLKDGDYGYQGAGNINEDIKVIYNFSIKVNMQDISKDVDVTKNAFNVYISGMDDYGTVTSASRSDVNIIATVNPKTRQILLTSIPRDYYVQVHGTTGYKDKLTHAGLYGVEVSVKTIEDLLDIDINYYVKVNFSSVVKIIDAIGGVDVYSEYDFTSLDNFHYTKGYNKVNGEEALSFARERKAFAAGDNQRGKNQQALLEAVIRKCISPKIIYKYNSLLDSVDGSFITNMGSNRITSLIKMQLKYMKDWNITSNNLVGDNGYDYTYSYTSSKLYVMIPDEDSILETTNLIKQVFDGEILDSSYDGNANNVHSVYKDTTNNNSSSSSSGETSGSINSNNNTVTDRDIVDDESEDDEVKKDDIDIDTDNQDEDSNTDIDNDKTSKNDSDNKTTDEEEDNEKLEQEN